MNDLFAAAKEIADFLQERNWPFCMVGGMAVPRWGEPRATQDVDFCLFTGLGSEADFIRPLVERFEPRVDSADAFAEENRVVLIRAANKVSIDVVLGWTPFEEKMLARATPHRLARNVVVPTATAEDLVVSKAFAGRLQDWTDVTGILARQRGKLDWNYIRRELSQLCELLDSPEKVDQLERLKESIDAE